MSFIWSALLGLAIAGVLTSTGYLVLVLVTAARLRERIKRAEARVAEAMPAATMMKPLCGLEPKLEENLASFFLQDYPEFEILFGTRDASDPALEIVGRLRERYPHIPVKVVFSGEPDQPNAKVCTLREMFAQASHEYVVISDSDVGVETDYLRRVVAPLLDDATGLVMCLYRGVPTGGFWAGLEALGMSVEMTAGVVAASSMGTVNFALGPTMATRRKVVESVGGIAALAEYCADDYVLGNLVAKSGRKVVISDKVIDHYVVNRSFRSSMLHQTRWMMSTRFSIPVGHALSVMGFALPFGVLAALAGWGGGHLRLGLALLGWTLINRMVMSIAVGWGVVGDRRALRYCWLYPLRDLMGFGFWLASYAGDTVVWRGEKYRLVSGGRMLRLKAAIVEKQSEKSVTVGVNDLP
ncbi:MAG: bacteriohopanetetrol glucosamine biosynthesis glycosyltransferase HpnI [Candidatus Korobacteraceae bacterium]|jgi:ceramide glucosyltransferase